MKNETKLGKRLENGLIEGIEYIRNKETNKIDWLKMVPVEHLYLNKDKASVIEKRLNKKISEVSINEALDTELVLRLSGINYLLNLRGYESSDIILNNSSRDFASATCKIKFIPNEEDCIGQTFTACASAHFDNTKSWYAQYLSEAASNRALCRAVRFYLGISTVSAEELGGVDNQADENNNIAINNNFNPVELLQKVAASKQYSFEDIKQKLVKNIKNFPGAESYTQFSDIPREQILKILEKINKN